MLNLSILFLPKQQAVSQTALYEPPDSMVYHGVGWGDGAQIEYGKMFSPEKQPLLHQSIFSIPGNPLRILTVQRVLGMLQPQHMDPQKQVPELSVHFAGPTEEEKQDSLFAFTDSLDHYIDTLAQAFQVHNRPVFLLIGLEMNGWWNDYKPWIFPLAFRKLVEGLRNRAVFNFASIGCYEPDDSADFADSTALGWKWYPGDDIVDWFGLDLFVVDHFDPDLPDSTGRDLTKKGRSEYFLQFARERGKPVYLNELSARHVYIVPDALDPDSSQGKADWVFWFEPVFDFLDMHPNVKAFNYINLDWTQTPQYAGWSDARIEINSTIRERWIEKLSESRFLHAGTDLLNPTRVLNPFFLKEDSSKLALKVAPNPFNATAMITFYLIKPVEVRVTVYNVLGQPVQHLMRGPIEAGKTQIRWIPHTNLSGGLYFVEISTERIHRICK